MTESRTMLTGQNAEGRGLSLTSDHLQALPKRHIDQFLLAYVQNQRQFLKTYASERKTGPTLCDRLRTDDLASLVNLSTSQDILVFGTPILRARVSTPYDAVTTKSHDTAKLQETFSKEPENRDQAEPPRKSHSDKLPTVTSKQSLKFAESRKSNSKSLKAPATGKERSSQSNKRTRNVDENHNSDDEQADRRLADRRKRKRARKDTMKPQVPNQEEQSDDREQSKKSKNQSKNVQAGFALMHGFSATNVGKNRLTLDPLFRNLGVFKKGKASTAAKVARGKAVKQAHILGVEVLKLHEGKTSISYSDCIIFSFCWQQVASEIS
ncbi:hypothetical protein GALMADRAFT_677314 [Galerina marginata CBS 339.88]|uniref:Uncharacterized protein n=1 Tax=Galerina marginata (strain CBS 339.88) TaxID=685588 RepID=A0A067TV51_GALM3|nr:hypothetical protein GALMADRAFT_677314 [Galerina marginata CBS 339.88]